MARNPREILSLFQDRKSKFGAVTARMIEVRDVYNGDRRVPLPELDKEEKPAVANLTKIGIDQISERIASTIPDIHYPAMKPGIKKSERLADDRRDINYWWWKQNKVARKLRRRARHLTGYGLAPVVIRIGADGHPVWQVRSPIGCWPAEGMDPDQMIPPDVIFASRHGRAWLQENYPDQYNRLTKAATTQEFDVVEYIDEDQVTLIVVGDPQDETSEISGSSPVEVLRTIPNPTGRCLAVIPGAITLDRREGGFGALTGMYQTQSMLMALSVLGARRDVFPETWIQSQAPAGARIRRNADAIKGVIGIVDGGTINAIHSTPGPYGPSTMDRIEYAARHTAGVPAEFGGQASTNIRTGARGEQVLSAVVDFPVQEAQSILEESLFEENRLAVALHKHYGARKTYSMYLSNRKISYKPAEVFETDEHDVRYAYTGADANGIVIQTGQKIGLETMSRRTAMENDPMVRDPKEERDRIQGESLEHTLLTSIEQSIANPQMGMQPADLAELLLLVKTDKLDLAEAYMKVQAKTQARQAEAAQAQQAQQQAQGPPGAGGPSGGPGQQMPGLNADALTRQSQEFAPIGRPPAAGQNFEQLISQLRRPQAAQPFEQAAGVPGGPQG